MKEKLKLALKAARKQLAVIICALVIIAGLVLAYWPTQSWYTDLAAKVDASISKGGQLNTILNHQRHMPNVTPDPNAPAQPLDVFPTQDVYAKGQGAVKTLGDQSAQLLGLAIQLNQHFPLDPQALPNGDDVSRGRFGTSFTAAVEGDTYIRNWPPADLRQTGQNYPIPPLSAGAAPTTEQIQKALADFKAQFDRDYPTSAGAVNPALEDQFNRQSADKVTQMFMQAADTCKVYLQPGAIKRPAIYDTFKNATNSLPPANVWTAQLWLWIVEDAATAVARANTDAKKVTDASVKQILDLTVKDPPYLVSGDPTVGSDTTALTPAPDVSPTGRVCNGMYDVCQFSMSLDVDADRLPQVLDALQSGQFLTILSVQATAVDSADRATHGFIYGGARIVKVDLIFEDLFLHTAKDGYSQWCPPGSGPAAGGSPGGVGSGANTANMLPVTTHGG